MCSQIASPIGEYIFAAAFPSNHVIGQFITYLSAQTDSPLEYHEVSGLVVLATATPGLRVDLGMFAHGLGTNLYVLKIGNPARTRLSTAQLNAVDLLQRAIRRREDP